jgi:hypothetical protein
VIIESMATKSNVRKYKIYALDNYMKKQKFIDDEYIEYEIQSLVKELENDKGYHMRIHPTDSYILFGDCDGFRGSFEEFANLFIQFLDKLYGIKLQMDDFSYTVNESKKGSFHYSVPRLYGSAEKLHEIHKQFFNKHKDILFVGKTKIVDVSVYKEHWFRYPMQAKAGDKNAIHVIKKGTMRDFVVEYIPCGSQCIDDKQYKGPVEDLSDGKIKRKETVKKVIKSIKEPKVTKIAKVIKESEVAKVIKEPKVTKVINKITDSDSDDQCDDNESVRESKNDDEIDDDKKNSKQKNLGKNIMNCNAMIKNATKTYDLKIIKHQKKPENPENDDEIQDDGKDFSDDEIEFLVNMLSSDRCEDYDDWLKVGICLRNINKNYLFMWKKWSNKSEKYERDACNDKWKGFNKNTDKKLTVGSLLFWCKEDNIDQYNEFIKERKTNKIIRDKFPGIDLKLGETQIVTEDMSYINLENKKCVIYGNDHDNGRPSMYIEKIYDKMIMKCKHADCFGKTYPCKHVHLTKYEMNVMNNGTIIINNYNAEESNNLMEMPKFEIFEDTVLNDLVYRSLSGVNGHMADIIYYLYKDVYNVGEDAKENGDWYRFASHRWHIVGPKNDFLSNECEKKLCELYNEIISFAEENGVEKMKINKLIKIKDSFSDVDVKRKIMNVAKERFSINNNPNSDFLRNLNANQNLIVFNNGVYDLLTYTFRDGQPSDRMSMTVGYDFVDHYSDNFDEFKQYLSDIQPNKEDRDFLLTYLSLALYGNTLEFFTILTGNLGRNGKTKFIELIGKVFGDFYSSVPSQIFTRPRPDANAPDPILLNLKNRKVVISSEPDKYGKLNSGFIKFITGRDATTIRALYENKMINFTPRFITFFVCNDIPETDDFDQAFSRRPPGATKG